MGLQENASDFFEPNITTFYEEEFTDSISLSSLFCIPAYTIIFIVAVTGSSFFIASVRKQNKQTGSRITLLLFHLSLADLIVCVHIPQDLLSRLTGEWRGGFVLCKMNYYFKAFGLYLSSLVLICVSIDRFMAIVFPLKVISAEAYKWTKVMIMFAWILAALCSLPMAVFFDVVEYQINNVTHEICTIAHFSDDYRGVQMYSIFSEVTMYFFPLGVIIFTYSCIMYKLIRKSDSRESQYSGVPSGGAQHSGIVLRRSGNAQTSLDRAKARTSRMTVGMMIATIFCMTPHSVLSAWHILDWETVRNMDPLVMDVTFLLVVANSCINPLIYGSYMYKNKSRSRRKNYCCCFQC